MRKILVAGEDVLDVEQKELEILTLIEEDLIPEGVEGVEETIQEKEDCLILFQSIHILMMNSKI